jgi:hypothetical protein
VIAGAEYFVKASPPPLQSCPHSAQASKEKYFRHQLFLLVFNVNDVARAILGTAVLAPQKSNLRQAIESAKVRLGEALTDFQYLKYHLCKYL